MFLSDLIDRLNYKYILNNKDCEIKGITSDSKETQEGFVFVCIRGEQKDGHQFVDEAVSKKAAAIIAENEVEAGDVPVILVSDAREALSLSASYFYGDPAKKLKIIGITGTNGKTSVSYMIKNILDTCGYKTGIIGTVNNIIGDEVYESSLTTPDAVTLHKLFAKMAEEKVNYVIMEVSSHALSQKRVFGIEFACGVITNVTGDHLDYHKTKEEYSRAKSILFENSKIAVLNKDDSSFEIMKNAASGTVCTYSKEDENADVYQYDSLVNANGVSFNVKTKNDSYGVYTKIPGVFTRDNALAAVSVATALQIPSGFVRMAFKTLEGIKGRIERVETNRDFSVFIDYAHTPDGLEKIIKTINDFKEGRLITLFGCGGNRDKTKRPLMGETATALSDFVIITSDNPRNEEPEEIIKDILSGVKKDNYMVVPERKEAIKKAVEMAGKDDIILLAGKGHETCQILAEGKIHFDEREILKELL